MNGRIRALAICLFRHAGRILVAEGWDPVKQESFYRPLGGGIEFGETGEEAVRRELREEINAEVEDLHYLFTLENIFVFNGAPGHEIVRVYDGRLKDESLYRCEWIAGEEVVEGADNPFKAVWKDLTEFGDGRERLYPDGLLVLLK